MLDIAHQTQWRWHIAQVASKKGVIGFGSPQMKFSRRKPQLPFGACGFSPLVPQFLASRAGGRKPCRFFRENSPGLPTRSSRRLRLISEAAGEASLHSLGRPKNGYVCSRARAILEDVQVGQA